MPFQTAALDSTKLEKLRGTSSVNPTYRGAKYMSLCPNTTIFAARVNGAPTGSSYAQITYDTVTTGAYTDVLVDMRVLISHTSDRRAAFFDGRARLSATSSILYINETSAAVADNDYIFVINDYPLTDRLAAIRGGMQFKDYAVIWRYMLPFVRGLQTAYCGWIATPSDVSTKFRVAFSITATAAQSGASISTYLWTFPGSATVISGATNAAAVTIDFTSSAGDWCHLKVTDSNGNYITRHFFVHAASDTYPPALGFTGLQIEGSIDGGWNASCEAFTGVDSVLDNTFAVGWDVEYYNGTEGALLGGGAAVKFVGRFRQESVATQTDDQYSAVQTVRYSLEGPAAQLARLESLPRALIPEASPNEWDEITDLTIWRAIVHILAEHSTFLNLHDISFDDVGTTFLTAQIGVQGGDIYRAVQDLAVSINAVFEFAPQGESRVYRDANYLTSAERNALVTVADFTSQDWIAITIDTDPVQTVGKVPASGGFYNSTTGVTTPLLSLAPGVAQASGTDEPALTRQYLAANVAQATAQSELNTRAGHHFAKYNDGIMLHVLMPDGYNFLVPSVGQWYTWTIAATDNVRGLAYTTATRWLCVSVSIEDDNERGTKGGGVNADFAIETTGTAGATIQYPTASEITPYLPDIPFDPYAFSFPEDPFLYLGDNPLDVDVPPTLDPDAGATVPKDGNTVIAWDESLPGLVITKNFLQSANPVWREVTPGESGSDTFEVIFDFTLSDGGFVQAPEDGTGYDGTYIPGTGWQGNNPAIAIVLPNGAVFTSATAEITVSRDTLISLQGATSYPDTPTWLADVYGGVQQTSTTISGTFTNAPLSVAAGNYLSVAVSGSGGTPVITRLVVRGRNADPFGGGGSSLTHINFACFDPFSSPSGKVGAYVLADDSTNSFVLYATDAFANPPRWAQGTAITGLFKTLRLGNTAGQILIFAPDIGGSSKVAVSSDYGITFGASVTVGTAASNAKGVDTEWIGTVVLAAADQKVRTAATLGGAFSDETNGATAGAQPLTIILPWYTLGSDTVKNTGATPDYILGASALVGGEALWKVTSGGGKVAITPSVAGTKALAVSANGFTSWKGKRFAYLGSISGTTHLFTTVNTGAAWTDRGAYASTFVLVRRRASYAGQYYFNVGSTIRYTRDSGATIVAKTTPLSTVSGFDIWG